MLKHLLDKSSKPKRVVVLGAAGFVGAACCRRLEILGVKVLPLSRTELDLNHPEAGELLANLLKPDDSLLFVAAKAPVKTESMLIENVEIASSVCQALKKSPVQIGRAERLCAPAAPPGRFRRRPRRRATRCLMLSF